MVPNFIHTLQKKRCNYNHPDQATSQANSLILLSSGIYTEEERFVFELLQNAVDAHSDTSNILDVKMIIEDDYFVFMHNGAAFTERDIEGLCDVGNGNKMKDVKKIGYKGVGFKSVFMRSNHVVVESGGYCFKFDKSHWDNYWDTHWNQEEYGIKDDDKRYLMPWQIIPIETVAPIRINSDGYNVVTYIKVGDSSNLEDKILALLSNSQFLLFLKSRNIKMAFVVNGITKSRIDKSENNGVVILSANGIEESRWLIHTNDSVKVPVELRELINADINTPDKLKEAKTFDLSFAIALDKNGKLKRLERDESVVYTYLPTSFRFGSEGFPFLVNANFITDAGRQQLHKDSEWNKLIFSKIPSEFLRWMKEISSTYRNYWEALPEKSYGRGNSLETIYAENMEKAINEIAFIPSLQNSSCKVLVSEAFMDRMGIADAISVDALVCHINRIYARAFDSNNQVVNLWKGGRILSSYGVFVFDKQKLKSLFEDEKAFENISVEFNNKLINFLFDYYVQNKSEQEELISVLQATKFLLDEAGKLCVPNELFFPSLYKEQNTLAENTKILNPEIFDAISSNQLIVNWLSILGLGQLSDLTFIENVLCKSGYVTTENALEVGRFIFDVSQREDIFGKISPYRLGNLAFLTTKDSLKPAIELYLSAIYKPEINIESLLDDDIFISEKYCDRSSITEWKVFLLKLGVNEDVSNKTMEVKLNDDNYNDRFDKSFFDSVKESSQRYKWVAYEGWDLNDGWGCRVLEIYYNSFTFLTRCTNYNFSKLVFSRILSQYDPEAIDTNVKYVDVTTGFLRTISQNMLINVGCNINHFKWVVENSPILPTVRKQCYLASDAYSNTIPHIKEIAGHYLPVIDVQEEISETWQTYLGVKTHLTMYDYLFLLTEIAKDSENIDNNKNRITCIYQNLIELGCLESSKHQNLIREWASSNRILSRENEFVSPAELSHITLDGFSSKNRVYIGNPSNREKVIELLALMGVKIITSDSVDPEFELKKESCELKSILKSKVSALALLASGEKADAALYHSNKTKLVELINNTYFFHCKKIKLTYGNSNDIIEKHTFGNRNEFYYIGDLRPANIEPLLAPLCKYLGIKGKEREMFIMFFETMDGIKQNLEDKGYDISLIEEEQIPDSGTINISLDYRPDESAQERNLITGFKGEILVYEKLKSMGYNPVCLSISTKEDHSHEVIVDGKTYYCKPNYEKYDIIFTTHEGKEVFIEVKATTRSKQNQENMPISYRELTMVEECNGGADKGYYIVRVFGIDQPNQDIYIFNGCILNIDFKFQ